MAFYYSSLIKVNIFFGKDCEKQKTRQSVFALRMKCCGMFWAGKINCQ
jgi:hypothetical protein